MTYLNFYIPDSRTDDYMSASVESRGIHFSLLLYCADQENGGIVKACQGWSDSHWQRAAGISATDVKHSSTLWKWSGDNLIVAFYNHKHEAGHQAKRQAAIITNQKRWGMRGKGRLAKSVSESLSDSVSESLTVSQRKERKKEPPRGHASERNPVGSNGHTP